MNNEKLEELAKEAKREFVDFDMPWPTSIEDVMDMNPSRDVCEFIAACSPDRILRLVAIARAAKYVALSNGFDAAYHDKIAALREALKDQQ